MGFRPVVRFSAFSFRLYGRGHDSISFTTHSEHVPEVPVLVEQLGTHQRKTAWERPMDPLLHSSALSIIYYWLRCSVARQVSWLVWASRALLAPPHLSDSTSLQRC